VLAQRLVRTICPSCKERIRVPVDWWRDFGGPSIEPLEWSWHGVGCGNCRNTGYRGRTGVYEFVRTNDEIRGEILHQRGSNDLRRIAIECGMRTLRMDGLRLVRDGVTTIEEVLRVTHA
jgi:general secretion pathway protein E